MHVLQNLPQGLRPTIFELISSEILLDRDTASWFDIASRGKSDRIKTSLIARSGIESSQRSVVGHHTAVYFIEQTRLNIPDYLDLEQPDISIK